MRDIVGDPKFRSADNIPQAFNEGDLVVKVKGDYQFRGVVVAAFRKRSGAPRYVVENDEGILHILNGGQLEHVSVSHEMTREARVGHASTTRGARVAEGDTAGEGRDG